MDQERRRLTADDWAAAALTAIGEGGLAAVAVEPLATRLGTTKGSFYWHFSNREALVEAALRLWEKEFTDAYIAALAPETDPVARLRILFTRIIGNAGQNAVAVNVLAAADHRIVAPVVRRVVQRRFDYCVGLFEEIGFPPAVAIQRATLGYTAYVGHDQLAARLPGVLPLDTADQLTAYTHSVLDLLLHDAPAHPSRA
ncbi:TetR/AcrR family transcriptional regulator [Streptomyces sp. H10-C2]|uniref:TetR/AcrR family transcriptional regulator n=1 Tax=unclassified Streptomyces TaxID=2593676 RepID=UPI0024B8ECE6|nr:MULTISPECIES: TetR/AcrR family transcriptional regulator [unclassified Streptomyces]MDJ0342588.1 TetR/AcrR family transcriptional regulator [Streptomyces sp. PH10-H1]MDJ0368558.1 TetR/AcrR family transcriptional regulator [Streptomyces sp. H10-C2]